MNSRHGVSYDQDPSYQRHSGMCRGCNKFKHHISNDDGYCGDCN